MIAQALLHQISTPESTTAGAAAKLPSARDLLQQLRAELRTAPADAATTRALKAEIVLAQATVAMLERLTPREDQEQDA